MSQKHVVSVLCTLRNNSDSWRPLSPKPVRDFDELDIWPHGELVGHDGINQIIRISIGRFDIGQSGVTVKDSSHTSTT